MNDKLLEPIEITKLEKALGKEFTAEIRGLSEKGKNDSLLQLSKYAQEIITAQKEDEALTEAKEKVKDLNAPYRDSLKVNAAKQRFIALLITEASNQK